MGAKLPIITTLASCYAIRGIASYETLGIYYCNIWDVCAFGVDELFRQGDWKLLRIGKFGS